MSSYCIAEKPTPILNTPEFEKMFGSKVLPLDGQGLLRCIEMVALPGTKFEIQSHLSPYILEITTQDYPFGSFYIDSRFVKPVELSTPERLKILPPKEAILSHLKGSLSLPYIWGGNWRTGIPEILTYYQHDSSNPHPARTLSGVDCSGLLYEATAGFTPRNTSELMTLGKEITSIDDVKPLDILVWPGHVVILLSPTTTIESCLAEGVVVKDLQNRLAALGTTKFVIRRFI